VKSIISEAKAYQAATAGSETRRNGGEISKWLAIIAA